MNNTTFEKLSYFTMTVNGNFFIIEPRLSICLYILLKRVAKGGAVLTLAGSIGLKKN